MSAYLITREGQELGSFETAQIQEGLRNGSLLASDWGWREGMSGWQGLAEIMGPGAAPKTKAPALSSPLSAPVKKLANLKPGQLNPYAAPSASSSGGGFGFMVPPDVVQELAGTKLWVRFLSVLMWIGCLGFLLFSVINLFFGLPGGSALIKSGAAGNGMGSMLSILLGYVLMAVLIIYPTLKLSKYASKIGQLTKSMSFSDLAAALAEQRRFWKFHGILMLIYVIIAVLFVILVMSGVATSSMLH